MKKKTIKKIRKLHKKGLSVKEIAEKLKVSVSSVYKYRREVNV